MMKIKEVFCYKIMAFGLKNIKTTYQRMMNKVFVDQIKKNMKVYVNNMLIKSKDISQHLVNLEETFGVLQSYNMRLNLKKCAFRV